MPQSFWNNLTLTLTFNKLHIAILNVSPINWTCIHNFIIQRHLICFSTLLGSKFYRGWCDYVMRNGGHLGLTLNGPKVKPDFPPHLKIKLMVCTNYVRNFMLFSKNAQFLQYESLSATLIEWEIDLCVIGQMFRVP